MLLEISYWYCPILHFIPAMVMLAEALEGRLFITVHVYFPAESAVSVCLYSAVPRLTTKDTDCSLRVMESLVQLTVVAGPPVEIQVRIFKLLSNATLDIVIAPAIIKQTISFLFL